MKTVMDWLRELPAGYRDRACVQCLCVRGDAESMNIAMGYMRTYDLTLEGRAFWDSVRRYYQGAQLDLPFLDGLPDHQLTLTEWLVVLPDEYADYVRKLMKEDDGERYSSLSDALIGSDNVLDWADSCDHLFFSKLDDWAHGTIDTLPDLPHEKTVEEVVREVLPKEYADLWIERYHGDDDDLTRVSSLEVGTLIGGGFFWSHTEEGHAFWSSVRDYASGHADSLPPLPKKTVRERIYELLPVEYADLMCSYREDLDKPVDFHRDDHGLINGSDGGFWWGETIEGLPFWAGVQNYVLGARSSLPPIPKPTVEQVIRKKLPEEYADLMCERRDDLESRWICDGWNWYIGFAFDDSPEGGDFWRSVAEFGKGDREELPPIPKKEEPKLTSRYDTHRYQIDQLATIALGNPEIVCGYPRANPSEVAARCYDIAEAMLEESDRRAGKGVSE